ncbi:hypothetical protein SpAn4DRAFT_0819 [Sporomusa ovata]|uniref:Uncharacterized protein n=1 Tax=Sporomusa ovata TaxID=2378 RepID=A0A0U1L3S2_9FIRM|nr:hypothetical protein SpAn4DRAFT_0819 [Sporomusa ovata]
MGLPTFAYFLHTNLRSTLLKHCYVDNPVSLTGLDRQNLRATTIEHRLNIMEKCDKIFVFF